MTDSALESLLARDPLLGSHRLYVEDGAPRQAFDQMLRIGRGLKNFDVRAGMHGDIRDVRYFDRGSKTQPFAFIVNRRDLLFYVRPRGLGRIEGGFESLKRAFPSARENPGGEWTVRVATVEEARRLSEFVFGVDVGDTARGVRAPAQDEPPWRTETRLAGERLTAILEGVSDAERDAGVEILAGAVLTAEQRHPGRWLLNLHERYVRLIAGMVLCLQFNADGEATVLLARAQAPRRYREGGEYRHAPGCVEVAVETSRLVRDWPRLALAQRTAMAICAEVHAGSGAHRRAHSPGLVAYLRGVGRAGPPDPAGAIERALEFRTDIGPTEKAALQSSRRGQGVYRDNLRQVETRCRVTGVADPDLLRASHIKPWATSTDAERLDGYNGLLLAPHVDLLFDRGWISFSDTGELLVAPGFDRRVLEAWRIPVPLNVGAFAPQQQRYLEYHRREVFGRASRA